MSPESGMPRSEAAAIEHCTNKYNVIIEVYNELFCTSTNTPAHCQCTHTCRVEIYLPYCESQNTRPMQISNAESLNGFEYPEGILATKRHSHWRYKENLLLKSNSSKSLPKNLFCFSLLNTLNCLKIISKNILKLGVVNIWGVYLTCAHLLGKFAYWLLAMGKLFRN